MKELWVEKYRPRSLSSLVGHEKQVNELRTWLDSWGDKKLKKKKKNVALLIGPPGVGKTTAAYAIAREKDWDIVEVNASDKRTKKTLTEALQNASKTTSIFQDTNIQEGQRKQRLKLILADEIDGIHFRNDRGGAAALATIIKQTRVPFICTANNPQSSSYKKIARSSLVLKFNPLLQPKIIKVLQGILESESLVVSDLIVNQIAEKSKGDLRAAINDLQQHCFATKNKANEQQTKENDKELVQEAVQRIASEKKTPEEIMMRIIQANTVEEALDATSQSGSDYSALLNLFTENAYKFAPNAKTLDEIYFHIAEADRFYARIFRTQNWQLLKYFFLHLSAGIALTPGLQKTKKTRLGFSNYFIALGRMRRDHSHFLSIYKRNKDKLHVSQKAFINFFIPYLTITFTGNDVKIAAETAFALGITEDELNHIAQASPKLPEILIEVGKMRKEKRDTDIYLKDNERTFFDAWESLLSAAEQDEEIEEESNKPRSNNNRTVIKSLIAEEKDNNKEPERIEENELEDDKAKAQSSLTSFFKQKK